MVVGRRRLADWIRRAHLTQKEAAGIIGLKASAVSMILTGERTPGLRNALKIEAATGIPASSWAQTVVCDSEHLVSKEG